jgi:hypothetical protein
LKGFIDWYVISARPQMIDGDVLHDLVDPRRNLSQIASVLGGSGAAIFYIM